MRAMLAQGLPEPHTNPVDVWPLSGYILASMRFEIILAPGAVRDLGRLRAHERSIVRDALEIYLRHEPTRTSRSRIKQLRGIARPQFRLRVGEIRVFYDVVGDTVHVIAIVAKSDAASWLAEEGDVE